MAPSDYKSKKPKLIAPTREELAASPYFAQAHSLAKLLADPLKPVHIPAPPKGGVKELRAPRDMMKNVQGSSAGTFAVLFSFLLLKIFGTARRWTDRVVVGVGMGV